MYNELEKVHDGQKLTEKEQMILTKPIFQNI